MVNFPSFLIYFSCFSLSIFFSYIYQKNFIENNYKDYSKAAKLFWFILIIAPPVFISTIRYDVGTDFFSYIEIFENIKNLSLQTSWVLYGNEPLFLLLNKISSFIFQKPWGIFLLSSLLIHIFVIWGLDFFKKDISIPFALFVYYVLFFYFGLNGIRQAIAMAIVFFSIRYIVKNNFNKFFLCMFLAFMFHNTAILCTVFYVFRKTNIKLLSNSKRIIYYLSILLTPVLLIYLIQIAIKLPLLSNYSHYISNTSLTINLRFLYFVLPILLPIFLFKSKILKLKSSYESLIDASLLNIPFYYLGYYVDWGSRMALYTNYLYILLIPLTINSLKKQRLNMNVLKIYFIIYLILYFVYRYIITGAHEVFPYKTILF